MDTMTITILEPEAKKRLDDMEIQKLIKIDKVPKRKKRDRIFGSMKGLVVHMADDFDAPMEDFSECKNEIRKSKPELRKFYLSAPVMTEEELKRHKEIKQWMNSWK